jgi:rod shape-determining protein MreC
MIKKVFIVIVILGVLFVILNRMLGLSERRIEKALSSLSYPILQTQNFLVNAFSSSRKQGIKNLLNELETLTRERDALLKEHITLKAFERTVADTADLRNFMKRYRSDFLAIVPILLRNFVGENFYLIDAGENYGIKRDMIALYENTIVGKVTQVYPHYSKVLLITDPKCFVASFCASNSVKGIYHGLKKGFATLSYVDERDQVLVGDIVLSSGEGGLFPRGFGLGTITNVDKSGYGLSIEIEPLFDLKKILYCCIVSDTISLHEPDEQREQTKPAES